nr:probable transcriptional regulator SLK2 [Tanacetum cinerariifolium]
DVWHCSICGLKSRRGFAVAFKVLPRLNEIKFSSGVIDERWCLGLPRECRFNSGITIVEYEKAVQQSVYEQLQVVHEDTKLGILHTTPQGASSSAIDCSSEVEEPRSVPKFVTPKIIFQSGYKAKSMSQLRSDESNVSDALAIVLKLLKRVHNMFYDPVLNSTGNVQQILDEVQRSWKCRVCVLHTDYMPLKTSIQAYKITRGGYANTDKRPAASLLSHRILCKENLTARNYFCDVEQLRLRVRKDGSCQRSSTNHKISSSLDQGNHRLSFASTHDILSLLKGAIHFVGDVIVCRCSGSAYHKAPGKPGSRNQEIHKEIDV